MNKKILIIEDDKFLGELISQKLEKEGYSVINTVNGEEGIKKAEKEKPDVILLDLILPGMDGFEILAKIKETSSIDEIPVIILSNLGQKEDIDRGLKMGADDFLIKAHHTPPEVVEKIKSILK